MKKNKKQNKKQQNYIKASDSKKQRAVRFLDRCALLLLAVIIVSLAVCFGKDYELSCPSEHGPALWFLHLAAWPLLFLPGVVTSLTGSGDTEIMKYLIDDNPALILTMLALLLLGIIYLIFRRYGVIWFGSGGLKAAGNFMLIFAVWGVFQLLICAVIVLQDTNTLIPFHPVKNPGTVEKK